MTLAKDRFKVAIIAIGFLFAISSVTVMPAPLAAQVTAFKQAVAEAASRDKDIAAFYQSNGYQPIWVGDADEDLDRRAALMRALSQAGEHGLPEARYDASALLEQMKAAQSARDLGLLEVALSTAFVTYAKDVQTGLLRPADIDSGIAREIIYRDRASYLVDVSAAVSPGKFLKALPPRTPVYLALMKEKMRLENQLQTGGWGPTIPAKKLKPGQSGESVVALRNRLIAKGYMGRSVMQTYDSDIQKSVQLFQLDRGLTPDGVAGADTISELNKTMQDRLQSIVVAMERERWLNRDLGQRHIQVNLTDFSARIVDDGKVTFETRSVIGKNTSDRRSPEFSDVMEFMVINPSWYVPRSIATKEYLPALKQNPNAVGQFEITDSRGRKINRGEVDFTQFTARNFPYSMRQPPSRSNALGLVKFMFPNPYNIYLHDTPAKNLFGREVRAFSHGCIRLADPFDFAYTLLSSQTDDPEAFFKARLNTGKETKVLLEQPVPVHIIYRTAVTDSKNNIQYRRDVYGRDGRIWNALSAAGVALRGVQG